MDDLTVALQRCYLQARLQPTGPVFLSIPMNFMLERISHTTFKQTRIVEDAVPRAISDVVHALKAVPAKKLAIVADYAVGAAHSVGALIASPRPSKRISTLRHSMSRARSTRCIQTFVANFRLPRRKLMKL